MRRWLPFALTVAVSLVIIYIPGKNVPPSPDNSDKLVHMGLFFALALTGWIAGLRPIWLGLALVVYAPISEILQAVLPIHRDGTPADALADILGVGLGLCAGALSRR